jgi:putative hydrolase of the HAD superfamily
MATFDDYEFVREFKIDKFLVTAGFTKMQESKVQQLGIAGDFKAIHIIDPSKTTRVKKDIFIQIMDDNNLKAAELIVAGDDPRSEIKAALELGIDAVLYDRAGNHKSDVEFQIISRFNDLKV